MLAIFSKESVEPCRLECFHNSLCSSYIFVLNDNHCYLMSKPELSAHFKQFTNKLKKSSSLPDNLDYLFLKNTLSSGQNFPLTAEDLNEFEQEDFEDMLHDVFNNETNNIFNETYNVYHGVLNGKK